MCWQILAHMHFNTWPVISPDSCCHPHWVRHFWYWSRSNLSVENKNKTMLLVSHWKVLHKLLVFWSTSCCEPTWHSFIGEINLVEGFIFKPGLYPSGYTRRGFDQGSISISLHWQTSSNCRVSWENGSSIAWISKPCNQKILSGSREKPIVQRDRRILAVSRCICITSVNKFRLHKYASFFVTSFLQIIHHY